jgi:hypothetical protein
MNFKLTTKKGFFLAIVALLGACALTTIGLLRRGMSHDVADAPPFAPTKPSKVAAAHTIDPRSKTNNNIAPQEVDALAEEKQAFFAEKNFNWELLKAGPTKPLFLFWVDRLASKNEAKAMEAFKAFSEVCRVPRSVFSPKWSKDIIEIAGFFSTNHRMASRSFYQMEGIPQVQKICEAVIPRLENAELREDALRILNRATMDVYEEKDAAWWLADFKNSKFGGFLQGLPKAQWINRPE